MMWPTGSNIVRPIGGGTGQVPILPNVGNRGPMRPPVGGGRTGLPPVGQPPAQMQPPAQAGPVGMYGSPLRDGRSDVFQARQARRAARQPMAGGTPLPAQGAPVTGNGGPISLPPVGNQGPMVPRGPYGRHKRVPGDTGETGPVVQANALEA